LFSATSEKWFGRREPLFKRDEVMFKPVENEEQYKCVSKSVSLATPGSGTFGSWFTKMALKFFGGYHWSYDRMIACAGSTRDGNEVVYYVSRGTGNNDIFVFTGNRDRSVTLYNFFMNVSVVEKALPYPISPRRSLFAY
jgi:hypothetical protein